MLLSICIPTFNRSEKLDNCLNSILISKQQYKETDFEICIADNNSSDDTKKIVDKNVRFSFIFVLQLYFGMDQLPL